MRYCVNSKRLHLRNHLATYYFLDEFFLLKSIVAVIIPATKTKNAAAIMIMICISEKAYALTVVGLLFGSTEITIIKTMIAKTTATIDQPIIKNIRCFLLNLQLFSATIGGFESSVAAISSTALSE